MPSFALLASRRRLLLYPPSSLAPLAPLAPLARFPNDAHDVCDGDGDGDDVRGDHAAPHFRSEIRVSPLFLRIQSQRSPSEACPSRRLVDFLFAERAPFPRLPLQIRHACRRGADKGPSL